MIRLSALSVLLSSCTLLFAEGSPANESGGSSVFADADPLAPDSAPKLDADPLAPDAAPIPDAVPVLPDADTSDSCSSIINQTGCSAGNGCYYKSTGDVGYCHTEGSAISGEGCSIQHDCAPGFICGAFSRCWLACPYEFYCGSSLSCREHFPDMRICMP